MKQNYDVEKIHPNPYQTRHVVADADLRALAESIREHGLQEVPTARPFAERKGHVELVKGHRRLEAWKIANPGKPMPVEVGDYTDRQMFDFNVIENMQRKDMTAIEQAKQIALYIEMFKVSQEEAGKLFNLKTQSAVSNKLRLLKLPASVQQMVDDDKLAERHARLLVSLTQFNLKSAEKIAKGSIRIENAAEREEFIATGILNEMRDQAITLADAPFDLDWLKKPVAVADPDVKELRDCTGCPHFCNIETDYEQEEFCAFAQCHALKVEYFLGHEVNRVSAKLKIAIAANGETLYPVSPNSDIDSEVIGKAIKQEETRKLLRLARKDNLNSHDSYWMRNLLGSRAVQLLTIDRDLLWRLMRAKDKPGKAAKDLTPEKRKQEEDEVRAENRAKKAAKLKVMHDVSWLVINASKLIGERLDIGGGLLPTLLDDKLPDTNVYGRELIAKYEDDLDDAIRSKKIGEKEKLAKQKELIALHLVGSEAIDRYMQDEYDWEYTRDSIQQLISPKELSLNLPKRWDVPPIHHTAYNCWHCGDFASNTKLTNRDIEEGWSCVSKGNQTLDVKCPACGNHKPTMKTKKGAKKK